MRKFELTEKQVIFLRDNCSDVEAVQKVLAANNDLKFELSVDDFLEFEDWLNDEVIYTLDDDQEPTEDTYMIESIIDTICLE